jgi:hypothetical protein
MHCLAFEPLASRLRNIAKKNVLVKLRMDRLDTREGTAQVAQSHVRLIPVTGA